MRLEKVLSILPYYLSDNYHILILSAESSQKRDSALSATPNFDQK
jgi:hypothetical protein